MSGQRHAGLTTPTTAERIEDLRRELARVERLIEGEAPFARGEESRFMAGLKNRRDGLLNELNKLEKLGG